MLKAVIFQQVHFPYKMLCWVVQIYKYVQKPNIFVAN